MVMVLGNQGTGVEWLCDEARKRFKSNGDTAKVVSN